MLGSHLQDSQAKAKKAQDFENGKRTIEPNLNREEGRPSSKKMLNASQQHLRKSGSIVDLMLKEEPGITNMFQRHKKMMQQQKNDETHQKDERKSLKQS